jgi:DNA-binding NarL/FixJ family response regulator
VTDGHYQLVLLDIQGVGLRESPTKQGLGILEHIKATNPAQPVIIYSAERHHLSSSRTLALADEILDKRAEYVEYKETVDRLLLQASRPDYYLTAAVGYLSDHGVGAPRLSRSLKKALRTGNTSALDRYLERVIADPQQVETSLRMIQAGIAAIALFQP